jgi:nitrate/nitrite transporter NarK
MLMLSGFFLGVGGAIFSVGVTSVPKYFSKDKVVTLTFLVFVLALKRR